MKENQEYEILFNLNYGKEIEKTIFKIITLRNEILGFVNKQQVPLLTLELFKPFLKYLDNFEIEMKTQIETLKYYNDMGICQKDKFT